MAIPLTGFAIGMFLDNQETLRMTRYRDKSALYGREVDRPSWPWTPSAGLNSFPIKLISEEDG